jgi:DNA polymerase elongation subunit (family B)
MLRTPVNIIQTAETITMSHEEAEGLQRSTVLAIHAYDWTVKDVYGDDDHVAIHCWSLDQDSNPYLVRFTNFPAFCHVELPMFVRNNPYVWRPSAVNAFMNLLSARLGEDAPIRHTYKDAKKTYYYRGARKFPMLQLSFTNMKAMQHCSRLLENPLKTDDWGFIKCNVWEDNISIVRKLLTVRDIRYSQWFRVNAHMVESELRVSTLEREYIGEWDTMTAIPLDECKNWNTKPRVLAFDIECYSDNHRAMPDKYNSQHVAYMISCIYQRYREPNTRRRYGIVIGECNFIPEEKLSNCHIITVNSEFEMVEAFDMVIKETDPEIITGYNILSFDYPYLDHRVKRWLKKWPSMGRIAGQPSEMTSKTWGSGAYGHQSINILQMEGRISIDLLPIVRRDYKLEKYDLNTVCKKFIGKTKHDITAPEMFSIYEETRKNMALVESIRREAQIDTSLAENPDYINRLSAANESLQTAKAATTRVMEYCIQDSELVIELMEKMNIWVGLVEMSNIVGTTIVELFTRGQQIRCVSQLYDLAARMGFILDSRDTPGYHFTGGFVYEPIPGLYDNIICLDFASLYPSIMMAFNICYTTLVPPEYENLVPDADCHVIDFDQDEIENDGNEDKQDILAETTVKIKKGKPIKKHYRFKFYKGHEGLLPRLVRQLVMERRAVNRQIAQIKDELKSLEKSEDVRSFVESYLNGTINIIDPKEAASRVRQFSESKPPAPPEVITGAKRELAMAQLFNIAATQKRLDDILFSKPPTHQSLIDLAKLELGIAQLQNSGNRDGLITQLNQLNESRSERLSKIESIKMLIVVLDKRQLALKVSANSFYGFLGVHNGGKMPLIEGAMSITGKGRQLIGLVRKYIEDKYQGVQIYGDTDSVMVHLPNIKDPKECNYWGIRLAQEISGIKIGETDCDGVLWPEGRPGLFLSPLAIEFEKAMRLLCLKKKKYAALLIGRDGNFKVEDLTDKNGNVIGTVLMVMKKGIILARRGNCKFLVDTYTKILYMIMNNKGLDEAIYVLCDAIQSLLDNKVSYEDLVMIRELGADYKSDSFFMKVFSDELKKAGKIVNPGDRLSFVIVDDPTATLLGHKMRLAEQYFERSKSPNPERIDYNYYIEKILMNSINQLFEVGFKNEIAQLPDVVYRPSNRHKPIHLDKPVQIILMMRERGYDINVFKEAVKFNVGRLNARKIANSADSISTSENKQQPVAIKTLKLNIIPSQGTNNPPERTPPTTPSLILPRVGSRISPEPPKYPKPLTLNITHLK